MAETEKIPKVSVVLDNGVSCITTKEGWTPEDAKKTPVLIAGWQPGKSSHHPISLGMALAIAKQMPEFVVGNYNGTPVVDPLAINEAILNEYIENHKLEVPKLRFAGDRTSAKKELDNLVSMASKFSPDQLEQLKSISPDLFAKLVRQ